MATYKIFNDSVHGHIKMHPLLVDIIDTPEFQRLRNIKQMGAIYYVFPGASHNRFEHSIGVCHLAGELVKSLQTQRGDISSKDVLCVQIAGLCHDLGHGPFSHAFEEMMIELSEKLEGTPENSDTVKKLKNWTHEEQSVEMFKQLISHDISHGISDGIEQKMLTGHYKDETQTDERIIFEENDIVFILELIKGPLPSSSSTDWPYRGRPREKAFLYEIVANKRTGIDVDKMDYISRDCLHLGMKSNFSHERFMMFARLCYNEEEEMQICMRDKEAINIYELFHTRYMLHYTVCHHRVKVAIEAMITDALVEAEGHFKLDNKTISEAVLDAKTYVKLTDNILMEIMQVNSTNEHLKKAKKIIKRIQKRKLYKFVGSNIFKTNELDHLTRKKIKGAVNDWLQYIKTSGNPRHAQWKKWINKKDLNEMKRENHFIVKSAELNYGKKEENPVKYLRFYRKNEPNKSVTLDENEVSYMLPKNFSETRVMVFYKGSGVLPINPPLEYLWAFLRINETQESSEDADMESSEEANEESSEDTDEESTEEANEESSGNA